MKNATFTIMLVLMTSCIYGQKFDHETQFIHDFKKEKNSQNSQNKIIGDLSGICDASTIATTQGAGIGWDDCAGQSYESTIEFQSAGSQRYNVYSISPNNEVLNDPSFGAYYSCYDPAGQASMPNGDGMFPTLFFNVGELGSLSFTGSSQWGEVYSMSNIVMSGTQLNFNWTNDYGEGADVQLVRQDGKIWEDLLSPCFIDVASDSLALVALYNAADGPNWNIPWDLMTPVRNWYGITLDSDCRVSEINMGTSPELTNIGFDNNNLIGTVPDEIGDLTSLIFLDLSGNQLQGIVLSKLTNLINLRTLLLTRNGFTGTIIPEISNLQNLNFISLSVNAFDGVLPTSLRDMTNLRIFFASDNNLAGEIPIEVGQMSSLVQFSSFGNNYTGEIPSEFGNVSILANISLDWNDLTGEIPASIGQLNNLTRIGLSFNQLEGQIPDGFQNIIRARLNNNSLSGTIPESFASLLPVFEINVSNNNLSGNIPSKLFQNSTLQALYFADNDFTGCIDSIANLCTKSYYPELDSFTVGGQTYFFRFSFGYNLTGNPKLAWEGDLERACLGENQIGAPCNDGDPNTENDGIDENCNCTEESVATNDIQEINAISIAPNPLSLGDVIKINIEANDRIDANIYLIDIQGKVVLEAYQNISPGNHHINLDSKELEKGFYILKIASGSRIVSKKLVIQ